MTDIGGVNGGAVLAALELIETDTPEWPASLLDTWGEGTLAEALSILIFAAMRVVAPPPEDGDCLHVIVPAVVARLRKSGRADRWSLPTVAAMLTAAAVGDDPWEWRTQFGAPGMAEMSAWRECARLLADMADKLAYREPGKFARLAAELAARGNPDEG